MSMTEADLALMRAAPLLDSDPVQAAQIAGDILACYPDHEDAALLFAAAYRGLGDAGAGLALLQSLAERHPDSPVIVLEFGRALAASGHNGEAIACLRRVVDREPNLAEGWRELSGELLKAGETAQADLAYARYAAIAPANPAYMDASDALDENRVAAAEQLLRAHLATHPDDPGALRLLATAAQRREDYAEAERLLTQCLSVAPCDSRARADLCCVLLVEHKPAAVMQEIPRLLALDPRDAEYRLTQASALRLLGRNDEALGVFDVLVRDHPDDAKVWNHYGHLLRTCGRPADAIAAYRQAIRSAPDSGEAYWSLANLKTFRYGAPELADLAARAGREGLSVADRVHFQFTLGKAYEDEERYAESFAHYARGNALQRTTVAHDASLVTAYVEHSSRVLSRTFFAERAGWGSQDASPIFVVGLPRSGSTLLEQILASHSQVEGTRELSDVAAIAMELMQGHPPGDETRYIDALATIGPERALAAAYSYLERTQVLRVQGRPHFVDKMPNNFGHIGLIHLMFPNAPIIDARRHPLGCGFSCYRQLFHQSQPFTYDLEELGHYYRDYVALMDHYDAVLPGRVHRVHYERMVADPEGEVRRLLEYCRLEFEPGCLRFHETKRAVQTISAEQVRQPLYSGSVEHWRHYEPWLGPLKAALGPALASYPA